MVNNLIINGIDFEKRIEDAKRLMHDNLDWRAQVEYGMGPYFDVTPIPPPEDNFIKMSVDFIKQIREKPMDILDIFDTLENREEQIDLIKKRLELYLLNTSPQIRFELHRIK